MQAESIGLDESSHSDRVATRYASSTGSGSSTGDNGSLALSRIATGIGFVSLGLGAAQLLTPGFMARALGAKPSRLLERTLQAIGIREVASGMGILMREDPHRWLWLRVAGDVIDLALLATALRSPRVRRDRALAATASVVGVAVLDVLSAQALSSRARERAEPAGIHVMRAVTINRAREEVYRFFSDFANLPTFMDHLESVQVMGDRSRWRAKGPAGMEVEWEARLVTEQPNQLLEWRSLEGSQIPNHGRVAFRDAPGQRGTELRVELRYEPPAGALGAAFAKLFGEEPSQQIAGDLRRLKQVLELGEVVNSDASIHFGPHPARPARHPGQKTKRVHT
jgi:uncharacterized membrane protein